MVKKRILILTADQAIYQSIQYCLQEYNVDIFHTIDTFLLNNRVTKGEYCLVIMDIQVSAPSDLEMLSNMRNMTYAPILTISENFNAGNMMTLFEAGADVCIAKPLDIDICIAQIHALIRLCEKAKINDKDRLIFGKDFFINPSYRQLFINGTEISVTRKEFDLLLFLAKHPQQVFSASQLYEHIWTDSFAVGGEVTVKAHIKTLRKKMQQAGKAYICNVWGIGYKFVPPDK